MTWILVVYFAISMHHLPVRDFSSLAECRKAAAEYMADDNKGSCVKSTVYNREGE
jgi:hypothetical protein